MEGASKHRQADAEKGKRMPDLGALLNEIFQRINTRGWLGGSSLALCRIYFV